MSKRDLILGNLRHLSYSKIQMDHTTDQDELPCQHKLAFLTQAEAQAAATVDAHRHGTKLKAYRCRHCHLWHLSSH